MANQYDWTPELKAKILAKIKEVTTANRTQLVCSACGHWNWDLVEGFTSVPVLWNVWTANRKSGFPCAAYVCLTCGNTLFFSLVALGFALEIGPDMDEMRKQWGLK
jgi:hypothetical protein